MAKKIEKIAKINTQIQEQQLFACVKQNIEKRPRGRQNTTLTATEIENENENANALKIYAEKLRSLGSEKVPAPDSRKKRKKKQKQSILPFTVFILCK